jgi:hypothetical protein
MGSDEEKTALELDALRKFIAAEGYPIELESLEKLRGMRKPDFTCRPLSGERLAFEVTSLCAEEVARMIARTPDESGVSFWTGDPTARIVRTKMHKNYDTDMPIELLCYWDARTVSTDDMIVPTIEAVSNAGRNPFRRVWYHGEDGVHLVCGDAR